MKQNKEIEQILLNDSTFEQVVKSKIEQEFTKDLEQVKTLKNTAYITDIKDVPKDKLFTKHATFEVINKSSKTKSYINGVQAEGYLGSNLSDRNKLLSGNLDFFVVGNCYVKFVKVKV